MLRIPRGLAVHAPGGRPETPHLCRPSEIILMVRTLLFLAVCLFVLLQGGPGQHVEAQQVQQGLCLEPGVCHRHPDLAQRCLHLPGIPSTGLQVW